MREKSYEKVKDRIKSAMEAMSSYPLIDLCTNKHDEAIQSALAEKGFEKMSSEVLTRCRKLRLAGWKPQRLSNDGLMKECSKLPRLLTTVFKKNEGKVRKGRLAEGTQPLGEYSTEEKLELTKMGKSGSIKAQRNQKRYKEKPLLVGAPPVNTRLLNLAREIGKELANANATQVTINSDKVKFTFEHDQTIYF